MDQSEQLERQLLIGMRHAALDAAVRIAERTGEDVDDVMKNADTIYLWLTRFGDDE